MTRTRLLSSCILVAATIILTTIFQPLAHFDAFAQQSGCQSFPQTGKSVCGKFLSYWKAHGGLAQQGYPLSGEFSEVSALDGKSYTVQYFERAVFEAHPEKQPPYDVLLSQLGTFQFKAKYPGGDPAPSKSPLPPATGTIEGFIGYPSSGVPEMNVYAIELFSTITEAREPHKYSVNVPQSTRPGEYTAYKLVVAPGTYNLVARRPNIPVTDEDCGAYSQYVTCGMQAACYDHSILPVKVAAGAAVKNINILDWYAPNPDDFCKLVLP